MDKTPGSSSVNRGNASALSVDDSTHREDAPHEPYSGPSPSPGQPQRLGAGKGRGVCPLVGLLPSKQPKVRMAQPTSEPFTHRNANSLSAGGGQWAPWPRDLQAPALASPHPQLTLGPEPKGK